MKTRPDARTAILRRLYTGREILEAAELAKASLTGLSASPAPKNVSSGIELFETQLIEILSHDSAKQPATH